MPYKDPEVRKRKARENYLKRYAENKEEILARNKEWDKQNRERLAELKRKRYHERGGKEYHAKYAQENREKYRESHSKWYKKQKVKFNIPDRKYGVSQTMLTTLIREITGREVLEEHRFEWCVNLKGNIMPVDIFIPELKLIVEYQGKQHYEPVKFGKQTDASAKRKHLIQKNRDKLKKKLAEDNGFTLIEFPYWDRVNEKNTRQLLSRWIDAEAESKKA